MYSIIIILVYIGVCGVISILYLSGVLDSLGIINRIEQAWHHYSPRIFNSCTPIPRWVYWLMVATYHTIVLGSHIAAIHDVIPYADIKLSKSAFNHPAIMYHMWFIHSLFYIVCILSDPGRLNGSKAKTALSIYQYDGEMYKDDKKCPTCQFIKPARSKHCNVCGICVFRFDHHCSWINCCLGAYNYRYFLGILLSGIIMTINGVIMCYYSLRTIYNIRKLSSYRYIAADGKPTAIEGIVLAQYFFQEYPRIVMLAFSLLLLAILLTIFTSYHLSMVIRNQTTNESYKLDSISPELYSKSKQFYNRGICKNILEVVLPYSISSDS